MNKRDYYGPTWGKDGEEKKSNDKKESGAPPNAGGDGRIYFYTDVDEKKVLELNKAIRQTSLALLQQATTFGIDPPNIYLHINSYGGYILDGLAGLDAIRTSKVPVITVVDGACASAATFLSVVGTRRLINKHSFMLIHQLSGMAWGTYEQMKDNLENSRRFMDIIKSIYLEFTKVPEKIINEILKRDLWFDAKTCLKYGLVDEIIG